MIDFDAVDFSEFCSKEVSSFIFFTLSVLQQHL